MTGEARLQASLDGATWVDLQRLDVVDGVVDLTSLPPRGGHVRVTHSGSGSVTVLLPPWMLAKPAAPARSRVYWAIHEARYRIRTALGVLLRG